MNRIVFIFLVQFFFMGLSSSNAQWSYSTLSEAKNGSAVAVIENKIFFHCGTIKPSSTQFLTSKVDVFDVVSGIRQTYTLPTASGRNQAASAVIGSKVIFAGGDNGDAANTVDIYDTTTGIWSTAALSLDRWFLAGAAANGKALFGGGYSSSISKVTDRLDIYNAATNSWTNTIFPVSGPPGQRSQLTAASIGNKIFFAGGDDANYYHNWVNIYDVASNQWLPNATLSQRKTQLASVVYKNKIYFVGGKKFNAAANSRLPSDTIDVYDNDSDSWSIMTIPRLMHTSITFQNPGQKRHYAQATVAGCKMFLVPAPNAGSNGTADTIAVYDFARNSWSYLALPHPRTQVTLAAAKNKVYFAGGAGVTPATNGVWYNHVDIYTVSPILQSAVNNMVTTQHTFGTVTEGNQENISIQFSNQGDYDLFLHNPKISINGHVSDFTVDYTALPDTLEPTESFTIPVSFNPTTDGLREITISLYSNDPNNPVYTFTVNGTAITPTNIHSEQEQQRFRVYPNPTNNNVIFETKSGQAWNAQLINSQGKLVQSGTFENGSLLDLSSVPSGLYFLRIVDDPTIFKIIKK